MISNILLSWQNYLNDNRQKQILINTFVFTIINILLFTWFMRLNEHRSGIFFNEPLKDFILPVLDLTWTIFTLTYVNIAIAILIFLKFPFDFLKLLQAYNLLLIFRFLSISIFPLEPPADMIPMKDPIIETIAAHDGFIYKDLFFSGHTATLFLVGLMLKNKLLKFYFYAVTCIVAFMLVKQQVHYSVDVLAAPVFAYICYYITEKYWKTKEILQTKFIERH